MQCCSIGRSVVTEHRFYQVQRKTMGRQNEVSCVQEEPQAATPQRRKRHPPTKRFFWVYEIQAIQSGRALSTASLGGGIQDDAASLCPSWSCAAEETTSRAL